MEPQAKVLIVGAGFGGLAAAKALGNTDADVTVVDRTNHHLFQPLLYQVATAALSPSDVASATRSLLAPYRNVTVRLDEVVRVDAGTREAQMASGASLGYDFLVLATGCGYSFFGNDAWAEHAPVLKTLPDALGIRERLLSAFERAEKSEDPAEIASLLTFVVVGGGPTGVEMAGAIAELARTAMAKDFRRIAGARPRVVLVEGGARILSAFPERLSRYAQAALERLGVEVRLAQPVRSIEAHGLDVGGEWMDASTVVWAAGTQANPAAEWIGAETARNRTDMQNVFGYNIIHANEALYLKPQELADRIKGIVGDHPVYFTFDIDGLDPAYAPGTGTPVIGGPSTFFARETLRHLAGINVVAADVVEVLPARDPSGITALAGSTLAIDLIYLMAEAKARHG